MNFGNKLKDLRINAGLTQKELADKLGVTKSTISYYEKEERSPSADILVRLATIFHVSTDFLLGVECTTKLDTRGLTDEDIDMLQHMICYIHRKNTPL